MATTPTPIHRHRQPNGREVWRTRWYDDDRKRRQKNFGYCDEVPERQARAKMAVWLSAFTTQDRVRNPEGAAQTYGVADLATDFLAHAKRTFRKNGRLTSTVWTVRDAMQAMLDAWEGRVASDIEGPDLAALRDSMIHRDDGDGGRFTRSVKTVNDRLFVIKQAFRWGREAGLVSQANMFDLMSVAPLKAGRCAAKPPKVILPVDEHWVAVTKPYCASPVRAMIDLQWLTGMRPGEATIMRACDVDMTGADVWLYTPHEHKMEHKGKLRVIPLGPQAQGVIAPFLTRPTDTYLFSPAEAHAEQLRGKRAARKTPLYPSHVRRLEMSRRELPRWAPGTRYSVESYRKAIHHGCRAAQRAAKRGAGETADAELPLWNPNQLRHAAATRLNKLFALEDVSITMGHSDLATTRIYARPDVTKAMEIARKVG